jgi:hypothetical protein
LLSPANAWSMVKKGKIGVSDHTKKVAKKKQTDQLGLPVIQNSCMINMPNRSAAL